MEKKSEAKCPKCGSTEFIPIVYGKPSAKGIERNKRGEIILGGCCVSANSKRRCCKKCKTKY